MPNINKGGEPIPFDTVLTNQCDGCDGQVTSMCKSIRIVLMWFAYEIKAHWNYEHPFICS